MPGLEQVSKFLAEARALSLPHSAFTLLRVGEPDKKAASKLVTESCPGLVES